METDFDSSIHHQHFDHQSPNLNSSSTQFNLQQQNTVPTQMSPWSNAIPESWTHPMLFSGTLHPKANHQGDPDKWFHSLPHFHQTFAPVPNSVSKGRPHACLNETFGGIGVPNITSRCEVVGVANAAPGLPQRRFLVFDKSGDQMALVFSSGMRTPVQCLTSLHPKLPASYYMRKDGPGMKREIINPSDPFLMDQYNRDINGSDVGSEMREDTEELNALLYSDDESEHSEDDEVISTGHSPCTMTAYDKREWSEESGEEVASSAAPLKRERLSDGRYYVPPLVETASSVKNKRCYEYEDDAESGCCDGGNNQVIGELGSLSSNKRSRKERIRQTVNILHGIVPGGKGKDAIVVLDEAIHYLRALKVKAKALGLNAL
uniref:Transcription factor bHLH66 n=1 Tax=Nothapodytes nimmoniana TaxID=159386 RepID=A0A9E8Z2K1_NOTNI|nr:transcription factor bHLH66 [Nothapodytes nimmoniana]